MSLRLKDTRGGWREGEHGEKIYVQPTLMDRQFVSQLQHDHLDVLGKSGQTEAGSTHNPVCFFQEFIGG